MFRTRPGKGAERVWSSTCPPGSARARYLRAGTFGEKMTNSTRQQIEGDLHGAKGTANEAEGKLTHDPDLEAEGRTEKIAGKVQKKLGQLEKLIGK